MSDTLGRRIFLSHLELSYRLGRKITLAEFGEMIARHMGRDTPFTGAAVSRWESGGQAPTPQIIEAIGALTHTDPGWISHGERSAAPRPPRMDSPARVDVQPRAPEPIAVPAKRKGRVKRRS
jgi:transcriptional regulator with XRE-family HTH domain